MRTSIILLFLAMILIYSCGEEENPEDRLFNQLPIEVKYCAGPNIVHGIDVSKWQGDIDWNKVAQEGHKFAFIRVSDGLYYIDSYFPQNWSEAKRVGIIRGAYQFFRPNLDASAQAQLLLDKMGPLEKGDLPPVIDVEDTGNLSPTEVSNQIGTWINYVESRLGIKPIIYSGYYFWKDNVKSLAFGDYLLWEPWYNDYQTFCPTVPDPWTKWTFWQWTSSGKVSGISGNVDRNIFDGTLDDLKRITYQYEEICGDSICSDKEESKNCPSDCMMMNFITPGDNDSVRNPVLFKVETDSNIVKVNYYAESYLFGTSTRPETDFAVEYTFNTLGKRTIIAEGIGSTGKKIGRAFITITILPDPLCGDGECNGDENSSICPQDCVNITFITPQDNQTVHNPVTFRVDTDSKITSVIYTADIYKFASSSDRNSGFEVNYRFNLLGRRKIIAEGFDSNQKRIGIVSINITILEEEDAFTEDIMDIIEDIADTEDITEDSMSIDVVDNGGADIEDGGIPDTAAPDVVSRDTYRIDGQINDSDSAGCGCTMIE